MIFVICRAHTIDLILISISATIARGHDFQEVKFVIVTAMTNYRWCQVAVIHDDELEVRGHDIMK